jgi:hypothetical protein
MNGKQAKRLRRAALGLATTLAEAGRDIKHSGYVVKKHENRFSSPQDGTTEQVKNGTPPNHSSYQLLVRKDSFKGIYKALKSGQSS